MPSRSLFASLHVSNGSSRRRNNDTKSKPKTKTMGNAESNDTANINVYSQRLSKPRTNTNSNASATPSKLDGPSRKSSNRTNAEASYDEQFDSNHDSHLSSAGSPLSFAASPNLSPALGLEARQPNSSSTSVDSQTNPLRCLGLDTQNIDVSAAIALLQELKKKASPEDLIALHKALLPTRNVDLTLISSLPEPQEPDELASPLIRRSSLLPAGVATRTSPDGMRKSKGSRSSQTQFRLSSAGYADHKPEAWARSVEESLASKLHSFDHADKRSKGLERGSATPSDLNEIGTHKLGSLRITNGCPSPEPSLVLSMLDINPPEPAHSAYGDGFVTASEGGSISDFSKYTQNSHRNVSASSSQKTRDFSGASTQTTQSRQTSASFQTAATGKSNTPCMQNDLAPRPSMEQLFQPRSRQRASDMAREYSLEMPTSPYDEAALPNGFHLNAAEYKFPAEQSNNTAQDSPSRSFDRRISNDEPHRSREQLPKSANLTVRPALHQKSDSGYSSDWRAQAGAAVKAQRADDVLRTAPFDMEPQTRPAPNPLASNPRVSSDSQKHRREFSVQGTCTALSSQSLTAEQRAERHRSMPANSDLSPQPSVSSAPSTEKTQQTPYGPYASAIEEAQAKAKAMAEASNAAKKQPRKLQKMRRTSEQSVSSQASKEATEVHDVHTEVNQASLSAVPVPAEDVSVNFSRRLIRSPYMASLGRTFASVDHTHERITGTDTPPESPDESGPRGRSRNSKDDKRCSESPVPRRRSFFRLRSRSRSKSQHRENADPVTVGAEEPMPTISNFGTVAQSLGGSPYDIATRQVKHRNTKPGPRALFHPHQITSEAVPATVAPMDDAAAAEFARAKSRAYAERVEKEERARSHSRSRSRHGNVPAPMTLQNSGSRSKRSASAHATGPPLSPVHSIDEEEETPKRPSHFRVGTVDMGNGVAQGRIFGEPMLTDAERKRSKRRAHSVSPQARRLSSAGPDEAAPVMPELQVFVKDDIPSRASPANSQRTPVRASTAPPAAAVVVAAAAEDSSKHPTYADSSAGATELTASPTCTTPPTASPWAAQTRLWADRRKSLGERLNSNEKRKSLGETLLPNSPPTAQKYTPTKQQPRNSPAIVVSRYVTPTGGIDPYQMYQAENPTDHRPAQDDVERTDSAITYKSTASGASYNSNTSAAAGERPAQYRAYHPADEVSMSKLTSPRSAHRRSHSTAPAKHVAGYVSEPAKSSPNVLFDRYSGGFDYGWERGVGFGGSAGTRHKHDQAQRKSVQLSESYGVDLSDVPVFLRRD